MIKLCLINDRFLIVVVVVVVIIIAVSAIFAVSAFSAVFAFFAVSAIMIIFIVGIVVIIVGVRNVIGISFFFLRLAKIDVLIILCFIFLMQQATSMKAESGPGLTQS